MTAPLSDEELVRRASRAALGLDDDEVEAVNALIRRLDAERTARRDWERNAAEADAERDRAFDERDEAIRKAEEARAARDHVQALEGHRPRLPIAEAGVGKEEADPSAAGTCTGQGARTEGWA